MADLQDPVDDVLTTWKDIASVIGRSVRCAQLWAKHRGMPVRYPHGPGTPVASRRELQEWLRQGKERETAAAPASDSEAPISAGRPHSDATHSGDIPADNPSGWSTGWRDVAFWPAVAVAALAAAILLPSFRHSSPPEPLRGEALALFNQASAESKRGEGAATQVLQLMNRALAIQPDHPDLLSMRGYALRATGQFNRAIDDLNRSIARKPLEPFSWYNRGGARATLGDFKGAISDFTQAIRLLPDTRKSDLFYHERGIAYLKLAGSGNYRPYLERALADFSKAIQLNPDNGWAYHQRGAVYMRLEEPFRALVEYDKAAEVLPVQDRYWLYSDRAWLKQQLGNFRGAAADRLTAQQLTARR